ncbi:hypothetical protein BJV82DRAFT_129163 [Fennellomyces sp. T-0311]|nr:hypothetical protein BJV82DRAFT_129163 [Fennellomyces sp. T-0311]
MAFIISIIIYITYILSLHPITTIGTSDGYSATVYLDQAVIHINSLTNVYMDWFDTTVEGLISLSFGDCSTTLHHQILGTTEVSSQFPLPTRFIWAVLPTTMKKGCIFATHGSTGLLLAKSKPYHILKKLKKRAYPELLDMHFDGVKYYMDSLAKSKKTFVVDPNAKQKRF